MSDGDKYFDKIFDMVLKEQADTRKEIKEMRKDLNSFKLKVLGMSSLFGTIAGLVANYIKGSH